MKTIFFLFVLLTSSFTWSQNGYVERIIVDEDTTYRHKSGQIYWKLYQGVKDAIIESTMPDGRPRKNISYPIVSREYDGHEVRFRVKKNASEEFTIVFHNGDQSVTYLFEDKTVFYKGEQVRFTLHD